MKIHNEFDQNSLEWLQARSGVVTASELDALITPKWQLRKGQGVETYLCKKAAETWLGGPLPGHSSIDMDYGHFLEEEAKPWYSMEFNEDIESVGFITTDDGRVGCSPDGLIGDEGGIEIKCPAPNTHVAYVLRGVVPDEYLAQVHGSMYVTGRKWWKFLSYRRGFPPLVITVERDEKIQQMIHMAVTNFIPLLDEAVKRLTEMNGGLPRWMAEKNLQAGGVTPESD